MPKFFTASAVLVLLTIGCTSTNVETYVDGGRVVGKSSFVRPFWVDKPLYVNEARTMAYMTYKKKNVHILELGLKQAQTEALVQSGKRFDTDFSKFVVEIVNDASANSKSNEKSNLSLAATEKLQAISFEVSKTFEEPVVKSEAVYWEEIEKFESDPALGDSSQELVREYQISVLVSFETTEITDRLSAVISKISSDPSNSASFEGKQSQITAAIENSFKGLKAAKKETAAEKKEVEAINTEMDSAGAEIESSDDTKGPRGRKVPQVITPPRKKSENVKEDKTDEQLGTQPSDGKNSDE
jgi:hypothetical protein